MKNVLANNKTLFVMALLLLTGCGLKANPFPATSAVSQGQRDQKLAAAASENAVVLTWHIENQSGRGRISHINIEKSQLGSTGNICKDCPRTFERIGQLQILDVKNEKNEYRYNDSLVEKGKIYSYRLKLCDEAGVCRESQTVEIDYK